MAQFALTFNGVNLTTTYNVQVEQPWKLPAASAQFINLRGVPGGTDTLWPEKAESKPIEIVFPCRIRATAGHTKTQFLSMLASLETALASTELESLKYWHDSKHWLAMWDGMIEYRPIGTLLVKTTIRFLAQATLVAD